MKNRALFSVRVLRQFGAALLSLLLLIIGGCGGGGSGSHQNSQLQRVACIGDSITYGAGTTDSDRYSYPAVLQGLLGRDYQVSNYGVGGTTALNNTDAPYQRQLAYQIALGTQPDIVIVELGTNDSDSPFPKSSPKFITDYKKLIAAFKAANPQANIYVCLPPPTYPTGGVKEQILRQYISPSIVQLAGETGSTVVDLFTPLQGRQDWYMDLVHPNNEGTRQIALTIEKVLRAKTPTPTPSSTASSSP